MDYRPNAEKINTGKSPLLNSQFRLSKASKRMLCNARNSTERAVIKQMLISAEAGARGIPSK